MMTPDTLAFQEALNDSISSGRFVDTKIILFSRRDASGNVYKPKVLYANSHVLKSVPHFNDSGFYFPYTQRVRWLISFKCSPEGSKSRSHRISVKISSPRMRWPTIT